MRHLAALSLSISIACGSGGSGDNTPIPPAEARPAQARDLRVQTDLLDMAHLADIDQRGLFIELGTPARAKYTVGGWGSGWGRDGADGDLAFTYAGTTGRMYFPVREAGPLTLRFHMKPVGSHRMQVFLNGTTLEGVVLQEGDEFRTYDVRVPEGVARAGENYLLLRFGGTTPIDGAEVSVAVASLRVIGGEPRANENFVAPSYDTMLANIELGGSARRSIALRTPSTVSFHVEVPEHAQLVFAVGAEGDAQGAIANVRVTPEGAAGAEVMRAPLTHAWSDQAVSLEHYAGQVVRIDMTVDGRGGGRVAWATPAIMIPPPEVAARPPEVRNVVLLLVDTMRANKLRPYNPQSRVQTPTFDRLAHEGVLFAQTQAPENWTKPSCASVLTGLYPMTHGAKTQDALVPPGAELISEAFDGNGFTTGAFIANGYVGAQFGFNQGWDHYTNLMRENRATDAANVFREAGDFIEQHRSERFFVYVQTIDPHVPYDPPADFLRMYDDRPNYQGQVQPRMTADLLERAKRTGGGVTFDDSDRRRLEALYDGEVTYHDRELGRFIERLGQLGLAENTLFVMTSDHGEEFHEHDSWGHGHSIFQELIGVPLVFYLPHSLPHGRRVEHTVSTLNIGQTLMDLTGVHGLTHAEGRSLLPDMLGDIVPGPQVAFSDFQDIRRVVRAGRYKLVLRSNLTAVMFDLETDPGEHTEHDINDFPVAGRYARILLGQFLGAQNRGQWVRAHQDAATPLARENAEVDETTRAQLRAIGYAN